VTTGSAGFVLYSQTIDDSSLTQCAQILSIAFEFAEYSLQHQLPNFEEVLSSPPLQFFAMNLRLRSVGGTT